MRDEKKKETEEENHEEERRNEGKDDMVKIGRRLVVEDAVEEGRSMMKKS